MNKKSFQHKRTAIILLLSWFALAWSWTLSTDSLELSGSRAEGLVVAAVVSIVNVSISGWVIWKVFGVAKGIFASHQKGLALVISVGLFAVADFLVAWLTAIIWIGPQGSVDNVLPLSSPTLLLIHTPLGFASRLTGFYGLAAFGWLTVFLLAHKPYRKLIVYPAAALCLLAMAGWSLYRHPTGNPVQAIIVNESLNKRVPPVEPGNADFVLFPEYGLDDITHDNIEKRLVVKGNKPVKYIGSKQHLAPGGRGYLNSLVLGDSHTGTVLAQDKHRLIPGGEDLSYVGRLGLFLTRQSSTIDYFSFAKEVRKSPQPLRPVRIDEETYVGAAVCSSIISPEDYRKLTRDGATILTNSASLGVFRGSPIFNFQQQSLARFMATANARYFLQAANEAPSYVLNTNGNVTANTQEHGALAVAAQKNRQKTPYTLLGEWLAIAGGVGIVGLLLTPRLGKLLKKK